MNAELENQKYVLVDGIISPEMADICARYATAHRKHNFQGGDPQAPKSHSVWGDFLTESLLETLQPKIEALAGAKLLPTYSFYRVYVPGEELHAHRDRPSCEVSCTLCLGYDYRGKDYATNKSQYVIFVTPEIIESASVGTEEIRKKFRRRE